MKSVELNESFTYWKWVNKDVIAIVGDTSVFHLNVYDEKQTTLEKIFERFYTVDHSRSKELSGTGLGLSIVKHAVNLHEGQIEALPSNDGAHFKITLPIVN